MLGNNKEHEEEIEQFLKAGLDCGMIEKYVIDGEKVNITFDEEGLLLFMFRFPTIVIKLDNPVLKILDNPKEKRETKAFILGIYSDIVNPNKSVSIDDEDQIIIKMSEGEIQLLIEHFIKYNLEEKYNIGNYRIYHHIFPDAFKKVFMDYVEEWLPFFAFSVHANIITEEPELMMLYEAFTKLGERSKYTIENLMAETGKKVDLLKNILWDKVKNGLISFKAIVSH